MTKDELDNKIKKFVNDFFNCLINQKKATEIDTNDKKYKLNRRDESYGLIRGVDIGDGIYVQYFDNWYASQDNLPKRHHFLMLVDPKKPQPELQLQLTRAIFSENEDSILEWYLSKTQNTWLPKNSKLKKILVEHNLDAVRKQLDLCDGTNSNPKLQNKEHAYPFITEKKSYKETYSELAKLLFELKDKYCFKSNKQKPTISNSILDIDKNALQNEQDFNKDLDEKIIKSINDTDKERLKRLKKSKKKPETINISATRFIRNPDVIAQILSDSKGKCECCNKTPFYKENDEPYLEVHHIIPLSQNGEDSCQNTVALCPNCHKRAHFGKDKEDIKNFLLSKKQKTKDLNK